LEHSGLCPFYYAKRVDQYVKRLLLSQKTYGDGGGLTPEKRNKKVKRIALPSCKTYLGKDLN